MVKTFLLVLLIAWLCWEFYRFIWIEIVDRRRCDIIGAIRAYNMICFVSNKYDDVIDYKVLETYDETLNRWLDFSYKKMVPPEVYDKIAPYITMKGDL